MKIKATIVTTIICTLMLSINVQAGQFIKPYGNVPSVEVQNINMAYEKLPQRARDLVETHGYSLYLADDNTYNVVDPSREFWQDSRLFISERNAICVAFL